MPKSKNKSRRARSASPTGLALLVCFVIAALSVALALRQLLLEQKYQKLAAESSDISRVAGQYRVTLNQNTPQQKSITLTLSGDRRATLVYNSPEGADSPDLSGQWSGDSSGNIITNFADKVYAFSYLPQGTGSLKLLNPDAEYWGAATLTLTRD